MLIVADDLTGALDSGAALRREGFRTAVVLDPDRLSSAALARFEVMALTTETRHDPAPGALLRQLADSFPPGMPIYKKIDSTLRGAMGAEFTALLDVTGLDAALVAPSFPAQGRGLVGGYLVVDGTRRDPHLPTLLAEQTGMSAAHISIEEVRSPAGALAATLSQKLSAGSRVVVADALLDDDLRRIADAVADLESKPLLAGSAGFAAWVPRAWGRRPSQRHPGDTTTAAGPALFVLGSVHPQTRAQIRALTDTGAVSVDVRPDAAQDEQDVAVQRGIRALAERMDLVLCLAYQGDRPIDAVPYDCQRIAAAGLARVARRVLDGTPVSALVAGGGDTAYALCSELGITELEIDGEVMPGLPRSHASTASGRGVRLVTKAGGFGGEEALLVARRALVD